jgi:flagellar assembly protein FliH
MATIFKTGKRVSSGEPQPLPAFNSTNLADEANDYLHKVREEAARIVAQAQREAEEIRRHARREGSEEARQAGVDQARRDLQEQMLTALPALRQFVNELKQARQEWLRNWENNAIHLASAIAGRIMRREAAKDPRITLGLIREALELAAGNGEITLLLNPGDYETLRAEIEQLQSELGNLAPTSVVPDPQITPAGCRVQTRFGTVDQQVEAQLARIEEELKT